MGLLTSKESDSADEMAMDFHFPTSKKALIIFVRNPELGKCKTRLAETIGDENALTVYKKLLDHTADACKQVKADRFVYYSEHIKRDDLWDTAFFKKKLQQGDNLGLRMHNAFLDLLHLGYEKVLIVGSDLMDLTAQLIEEAYSELDSNDVVIGPAMDGGYYLLGMKKLYPQLFENKNWGTSSVAEDTFNDLKGEDLSILKKLNDIDTFEDLQQYHELKTLIQHD